MDYSSDESSFSSSRYISDHSSDYLSDQSSDNSYEESIDESNIYDIINDTFSETITKYPLINDGPLNKQMESRTEALLWLTIELSEYDRFFDRDWFNSMYNELSYAIRKITEFIDETDNDYNKLCEKMPSPYHDYLTVFGDDFGRILNDARTTLLERFNERISRGDWIKIYTADGTNDKPLPFLDELIIKT